MGWINKKKKKTSVKKLWEDKQFYGQGIHKKILSEEDFKPDEKSKKLKKMVN